MISVSQYTESNPSEPLPLKKRDSKETNLTLLVTVMGFAIHTGDPVINISPRPLSMVVPVPLFTLDVSVNRILSPMKDGVVT